jgi:hypothetical protein
MSAMLLYHHYIENYGNGGKSEIPPKPMTVIDKVLDPEDKPSGVS